MNHQPFEEWLLAENPLTPSEKLSLEAHLRECRACTALAEVNLALRSVQPVSPPEGFVERFRQRLAARQQAQRKMFLLGFVLLIISTLGLLTALSWPLLVALFSHPSRLILEWAYSLVSICATVQALWETTRVLVSVGVSLIPAGLWIASFLLLSTLCLLGIASLTKFTRIPQGVLL